MIDIIVISGAPGSGKSTISKLLWEKLNKPPIIDFGKLREFHLDLEWSNANKIEENMTFENLIFIINNYIKYKYNHIIIHDFTDTRICRISEFFNNMNYVIFSLTLENDEELEKRVLSERDSGWKNYMASIEWNKKLKERKVLPNEYKVDNTHNNPEKTVENILGTIKIIEQSQLEPKKASPISKPNAISTLFLSTTLPSLPQGQPSTLKKDTEEELGSNCISGSKVLHS
jgi:adenylate kinase family enzyme